MKEFYYNIYDDYYDAPYSIWENDKIIYHDDYRWIEVGMTSYPKHEILILKYE